MNAENNIVVEAIDVKKYYKGDAIKALDGVSMKVKKGEVVVIIGPSGSGKSTFLRSLNLLEIPTSGSILFHGTDIAAKDVDINLHRQKMGMVFQHFNLFPHMTILKNLTAAPMKLLKKSKAEAEAKAHELLKRVGLDDRADAYPSQLSGGQKQRIAIAGVIAMLPECIIFDESTAMLDPGGRAEVMNTIDKLNRENGITVLHITHNMEEALKADRVVVINDGEVFMDGTPSEVFSRVEKLRAVGLDVPQVTELMHDLKALGIDVGSDGLDEKECAEKLASMMKKGIEK